MLTLTIAIRMHTYISIFRHWRTILATEKFAPCLDNDIFRNNFLLIMEVVLTPLLFLSSIPQRWWCIRRITLLTMSVAAIVGHTSCRSCSLLSLYCCIARAHYKRIVIIFKFSILFCRDCICVLYTWRMRGWTLLMFHTAMIGVECLFNS